MNRIVPKFEYRCHACGTVFIVFNRHDPDAGEPFPYPSRYIPDACAACDAPLRFQYPIEVGWVKDLILTHYRVPYHVREYGTVEKFLMGRCRTPEDVDAHLRIAAHMDYEAWLARARSGGEGPGGLRVVERARSDAVAGRLGPRLDAQAAPVREELAALRAKHLAIFEERKRNR